MTIVLSVGIGIIRTIRGRIVYSDDPTKWEMPYGSISIIDLTVSPNYELAWIYQVISVCAFCLMISSIDLIIAGVMAHISTQCKILQNSLRRMVQNASLNMLTNSRMVYLHFFLV